MFRTAYATRTGVLFMTAFRRWRTARTGAPARACSGEEERGAAMATEQDVRLNLLNTLLTTPHRKLDEVWPVHRDMVSADPRFYVRLAAWYADNGDVRDHKEMFVVTL